MATITVQSVVLHDWHGTASAVELRLYLDRSFISADNVPLQAGSPPHGQWYKKITCTIGSNTLTIPSFTLDSTRDGLDLQTARYSAYFFDSSSNTLIAPFQGFESFQVPEVFDTGTTASWQQIREFNAQAVPAPVDKLTYTRTEIDAKIASISTATLTNPMTEVGDVIVGGAGGTPTKLAKGLAGTYLKANATTLEYGSVTSADVTTALGYTPVSPTRQINTTAPLAGGGALSSDLTLSLSNQSGNTVLASPSDGSSGAPTFRTLVANDIPAIPASKINTVLGLAYGGTGINGTTATNGQLLIGGTGGLQLGTVTAGPGITVTNGDHSVQISNAGVTSVGLSMPAMFTVTGSPVTTTGTLTVGLSTQNANLVFAGPSSGAAAAPTFRALVADDIPALDFSKITTGIVPLSQGGLGQAYTATSILDGHLLIGHDANNNFSLARLTAGSGINIYNNPGSITIEAVTGGGGTVTSVGLALSTAADTVLSVASSTSNPITGSGTFTIGLDNQNANLVFAGPSSGAAAAPTFRALVADDIPNLSAAKITSGVLGVARGGTGVDGSTAANGQLLIGNGTGFTLSTLTAGSGISITNAAGSITIASSAAGGTVTSVGLDLSTAADTVLSVTSSTTNPITGSGTFTIGLDNQNANLVFAGPSSGAAAAPAFRALVSDDIPGLPATKITSGTLGVARGGTGVDGSTAANGQLLIGNGAGFSLGTLTAGSGISISNGSGTITISSTSTSTAWSSLTAATADLALDMNAFTTTMTWDQNTGTSTLFTLKDTATNTGTGYIFQVETVSGSSSKPLKVVAGSVTAIDVSNSGNISFSGAVDIAASAKTVTIKGTTSGGVTLQAAASTTSYTITFPSQAPTTSDQVALFSSSGTMTFSDTLKAGAGAESTPSYTFSADTNTGLYSSTADTLDITTGGARKMSITPSVIRCLASIEQEVQAGLVLKPYGVSSGQTSELRFLELAANGTNYVGFKAPDALASSVAWTLPSADGSAGQVLQTNGSGVLSFASVTSTPPLASASHIVLYDDFLYAKTFGSIGEYQWNLADSVSGTPSMSHTVIVSTTSSVYIGILTLETGGAANNNCGIIPTTDGATTLLSLGNLIQSSSVPWRMECVFRCPVFTSIGVYIGIGQSSSVFNSGTQGAYLRYDTSQSDTKFKFVTRAASATVTDTGVTPVASNWYKIRIESTTAGEIKFSLNDGTVTTHTTNIPSSMNIAQLAVHTRTTVPRYLDIDYWSFYSNVHR